MLSTTKRLERRHRIPYKFNSLLFGLRQRSRGWRASTLFEPVSYFDSTVPLDDLTAAARLPVSRRTSSIPITTSSSPPRQVPFISSAAGRRRSLKRCRQWLALVVRNQTQRRHDLWRRPARQDANISTVPSYAGQYRHQARILSAQRSHADDGSFRRRPTCLTRSTRSGRRAASACSRRSSVRAAASSLGVSKKM